MGLISRLELLLPGDMMLTGDGETLDMSGVLSYQEELSKGVHISKREKDYQNQYNYILRQCVPIERNGEKKPLLLVWLTLISFLYIFLPQIMAMRLRFIWLKGRRAIFCRTHS